MFTREEIDAKMKRFNFLASLKEENDKKRGEITKEMIDISKDIVSDAYRALTKVNDTKIVQRIFNGNVTIKRATH